MKTNNEPRFIASQELGARLSNGAIVTNVYDAYQEGLRASPATQAPEGWQLVPVEPTQEMLNALHVGLTNGWKAAYSAMLAAAPIYPEKA